MFIISATLFLIHPPPTTKHTVYQNVVLSILNILQYFQENTEKQVRESVLVYDIKVLKNLAIFTRKCVLLSLFLLK